MTKSVPRRAELDGSLTDFDPRMPAADGGRGPRRTIKPDTVGDVPFSIPIENVLRFSHFSQACTAKRCQIAAVGRRGAAHPRNGNAACSSHRGAAHPRNGNAACSSHREAVPAVGRRGAAHPRNGNAACSSHREAVPDHSRGSPRSGAPTEPDGSRFAP
jgi:hypothetical protein